MIKVCILSSALKKLMKTFGLELTDMKHCDVVLAGEKIKTNHPVVVYDSNKNIARELAEARSNQLFKPLNDSITESLKIIRAKS